MSDATQRFVLIGPHTGKTISVNGHPFENGEYTFSGNFEQVATLTRIFGLYGAVPEQQAELESLRLQAQQSASAAPVDASLSPRAVSAVDAISQLDPDAKAEAISDLRQVVEVLDGATAAGTKLAEALQGSGSTSADDLAKALGEETSTTTAPPAAELGKLTLAKALGEETSTTAAPPAAELGKLTLAEAIGKLDPENDAHWTSNNLPALDDLAAFTGQKVGRAEVEAIAPGYTRTKARAARAA